jgi:hypothetical protein
MYGVDRYADEFKKIIKLCGDNPSAELEYRFKNPDAHRLFECLTTTKWTVTKYTSMTFEADIRIQDGTKHRKHRIHTMDLPIMPNPVRLSLAQETPTDAATSGTPFIREITRHTYKHFKYDIMVSRVNDAHWEVEAEFTSPPKTQAELVQPLEEVLRMLYPDHISFMLHLDAERVVQEYNREWEPNAMDGLIRRVGYKPLNFTPEDIALVHDAKYAVSNKLDGTKYNLISHDNNVFIVNNVDAQWICQGEFAGVYDAEWACGKLNVFDWQTKCSEDYHMRFLKCQAVVAAIANEHICTKHVVFEPSDDTDKKIRAIVAWMAKTYAPDYTVANDGIIFTPVEVPYLAARERPSRTLKYKFPDKISVDLRLRLVSATAVEKIFDCYAQDVRGETLIREARVTVEAADPWYDRLNDGDIAEIVLMDGVFGVSRVRADKLTPNFITVVQETLKDMYEPLELEQLYLKKGGSQALSITPVTDELIESAAPYIEQDRAAFNKFYECIFAFAQANKLKLSNPECFIGKHSSVINLYSSQGLATANNLSNELFALSQIVFMKTVMPHVEFEISVLNRTVARVFNYPRPAKHIRTDGLFESELHDGQEFIDPEIELIEIYHRLYMPFPNKWDATLNLEERLSELVEKRHHIREGHVTDDIPDIIVPLEVEGGRDHNRNHQQTPVHAMRRALFAALEFNTVGMLIGHWAYHELQPKTPEPIGEKVQLLTEFEPDAVREKVENILREFSCHVEVKTNELYIPHDMLIRRTTYTVHEGDKKTPLLDTFNSLDYEMVPYVYGATRKVKVANPFAIARFLLIDRWTLSFLKHGNYITPEVFSKKARAILEKVGVLRALKDHVFLTDYDGVYKDLVIERRRLLKLEDKFRPYKPLDSFKMYGKLKQIL